MNVQIISGFIRILSSFLWQLGNIGSSPASTVPTVLYGGEWRAEKQASSMFLSYCTSVEKVLRVCRSAYLWTCVFMHSHTRLHTSDLSMHERNNTHRLSLPICLFTNINTHTLSHTQSIFPAIAVTFRLNMNMHISHTQTPNFDSVCVLTWSFANPVCKKKLFSPLLFSSFFSLAPQFHHAVYFIVAGIYWINNNVQIWLITVVLLLP